MNTGSDSQLTRDQTARSHEPAIDDGVDVTLIRWMLSLSPSQRLRILQRNVRSIIRLRNARSRT